MYSKVRDRECLAGGQNPCLMLWFLAVRLLETYPCCAVFLCQHQGRVAASPAGGWLLAMPTVGKLEPLPLLSASASYFPFSASSAFSGGPSTLHFQDFPRWLLCNPDVVYLFVCHFKSNNTEKGIEWDKCLLHRRKKKGTCHFPACAFLRLRRLWQSVAPLLKASSHFFTTRRLLFSEKLGFRDVISKEVSALYGSAQAIYMLHLGNLPLSMVRLATALWQPVVSVDPLWGMTLLWVVLPWG